MRRLSHAITLISLAAFAVVGQVRGDIFFGAAGATVVEIDGATGVATVLNANVGFTVNALAFDSVTKTLYGLGNNSGASPFFTIDTDSGAVSILNADAGRNVVSLDFDDSTQTLYGAAFFSGLPRGFGTVDLVTGAFTAISTNIGHDIDSIAFGAGGTLFAIGPSSGADDLFTIDIGTGIASAPILSDIGPNNFSMDYDYEMASLLGGFAGGGGTLTNWRSIDSGTGAVSAPINPNIGYHPLTALTAVPEAHVNILLGLGLIMWFVLVARRRTSAAATD